MGLSPHIEARRLTTALDRSHLRLYACAKLN
jgi:hypothetical protein